MGMNKKEALELLGIELKKWRIKSYDELIKHIDCEPFTAVTNGEGGVEYQLEVQCFWDDEVNAEVRVLGCIDDGGWRAFLPLSDSFIMAPDGTFVDED